MASNAHSAQSDAAKGGKKHRQKFPNLVDLQLDVMQTINGRLAPKTVTVWNSKEALWMEFNKGYQMEPTVINEHKILCFLAWRRRNYPRGLGREGARGLVYAIRNFGLKFDVAVDVTQRAMPRLHSTYLALDKLKPSKGGAAAITTDILGLLLTAVPPTTYDNLVWRAMFTFAHDGVKRDESYTTNAPSLSQLRWNGQHWQLPQVVRFAIFLFDQSKTNQQRQMEYALFLCNCPAICGLHEMHRMLEMREGLQSDSLIFVLSNGKVIDYTMLRTKLKQICAKVGLDESRYTSHGFRKGGAQDMLMDGVPHALIMRQAGWKSIKTLHAYLRNMSSSNSIGFFLDWYSKQKQAD